ncbi:MAG: hypothetical protein M3Y53_03525 [Thermoproteota archaeon]|nr:hypothetical protein [Thermoproteota archaeon]
MSGDGAIPLAWMLNSSLEEDHKVHQPPPGMKIMKNYYPFPNSPFTNPIESDLLAF